MDPIVSAARLRLFVLSVVLPHNNVLLFAEAARGGAAAAEGVVEASRFEIISHPRRSSFVAKEGWCEIVPWMDRSCPRENKKRLSLFYHTSNQPEKKNENVTKRTGSGKDWT